MLDLPITVCKPKMMSGGTRGQQDRSWPGPPNFESLFLQLLPGSRRVEFGGSSDDQLPRVLVEGRADSYQGLSIRRLVEFSVGGGGKRSLRLPGPIHLRLSCVLATNSCTLRRVELSGAENLPVSGLSGNATHNQDLSAGKQGHCVTETAIIH